jgi:hypothetical protein
MEELTGILFVVAAIILKVVEAKFKKASKTQAPKVERRQTFPEMDDRTDDVPEWVRNLVREEPVKAEPVEEKPVVKTAPVAEPATILFEEARKPMKKAPVRPAKALNQQDEEKKTSEKIDPKKLIVYSEIMNRKY